MPDIRNQSLLKKFFDFFDFKSGEGLNPRAGEIIVPVVPVKIPKRIIVFTPTEAELSTGLNVPSGVTWKVLAVDVVLTSDANAGNREFLLTLLNDPAVLGTVDIASRNLQIASTTVTYSYFIGAGSPVGSGSSLFQTLPLPQDWPMREGAVISGFVNSGGFAGDTLTATVVVEETPVFDNEIVDRAVP